MGLMALLTGAPMMPATCVLVGDRVRARVRLGWGRVRVRARTGLVRVRVRGGLTARAPCAPA